MNLLEKAVQIAAKAHEGQTDKGGRPYILHLIRVMLRGHNDKEMICGVLHDLVEDTAWTFDQLKKEGFPDDLLMALDSVTKRQGESYEDFIKRIAQNPLAIKVKLNDLSDNMEVLRLKEINEIDRQRLNKYLKSYRFLSNLSK